MKQFKLELPETKEGIVTIADISSTFSGVIIAVKNSNAVGMIMYDVTAETWYYNDDISYGNYTEFDDSLIALIKRLLNDGTCDSFNVIKFE